MKELINQLGIDWRLLISQAVNFLILLVVLRVFAYKPILGMLKERRARIEEGMAKAKEADTRLQESNAAAKEKMKQTEQEAILLMRKAEADAKRAEAKLMNEAKIKEAALFAQAETIMQGKAEEAKRQMRREAAAVVKAAIAKTVELNPKDIDDTLINKAVKMVSE